jgi:hypothetical protein
MIQIQGPHFANSLKNQLAKAEKTLFVCPMQTINLEESSQMDGGNS